MSPSPTCSTSSLCPGTRWAQGTEAAEGCLKPAELSKGALPWGEAGGCHLLLLPPGASPWGPLQHWEQKSQRGLGRPSSSVTATSHQPLACQGVGVCAPQRVVCSCVPTAVPETFRYYPTFSYWSIELGSSGPQQNCHQVARVHPALAPFSRAHPTVTETLLLEEVGEVVGPPSPRLCACGHVCGCRGTSQRLFCGQRLEPRDLELLGAVNRMSWEMLSGSALCFLPGECQAESWGHAFLRPTMSPAQRQPTLAPDFSEDFASP